MREIGIDPTVSPSGTGCVGCDAAEGWWVHLRRCAQCGHIGCGDSSPGQHAAAHFRETSRAAESPWTGVCSSRRAGGSSVAPESS